MAWPSGVAPLFIEAGTDTDESASSLNLGTPHRTEHDDSSSLPVYYRQHAICCPCVQHAICWPCVQHAIFGLSGLAMEPPRASAVAATRVRAIAVIFFMGTLLFKSRRFPALAENSRDSSAATESRSILCRLVVY